MTHLAICIPNTGTVNTPCFASLLMAGIRNQEKGIIQSCVTQEQAGIAASRNILAQKALDLGADLLLWVDSDIGFLDPAAILKLIEHDKDIVGATYPKRRKPHDMVGRPLHPEEVNHGLHEFEFMGFGLMLVKADVFRKIKQPWFFETSGYNGWSKNRLTEMLLDNIFMDEMKHIPREVAEDIALYAMRHPEVMNAKPLSAQVSEDVNFCRKARGLFGYKIWCDMDITRKIMHGEVMLGDTPTGVKTIVNADYGQVE